MLCSSFHSWHPDIFISQCCNHGCIVNSRVPWSKYVTKEKGHIKCLPVIQIYDGIHTWCIEGKQMFNQIIKIQSEQQACKWLRKVSVVPNTWNLLQVVSSFVGLILHNIFFLHAQFWNGKEISGGKMIIDITCIIPHLIFFFITRTDLSTIKYKNEAM